ncbi:hypothetical protein DSM104443_03467 [Usitatibacter rugosus]|uniref:Uncharacterized protein n=1 Tax=Usitatibacter rugosus TaxID=2732067 RepID=A0A6M4GYN9_9PROT|nr:hypothetical protein [Usitatibacter rugosus]QJR12381.1 hypothetical protein DSM104443_03467 [Usitatibacter rugosus]
MSLPREWIGLALVLAGLARAALLIAHEPIVGYANQYDMARTSACTGLYPAVDVAVRERASPEAPLPLYSLGAPKREGCYPSTEVALTGMTVAAAVAFGAPPTQVRLKWIGTVKLTLLAVVALLLAFAFHGHPAAALYHGLVFFFVMADPAVTLWLNTLYTEFALLASLYACIGAICAIALTDRGSLVLSVTLAGSLVALAFSREQFALLAPALVAAAWPWLWRRSPHFTVTAFGIAVVASMLAFGLLSRPGAVREVNRTNTYLGVVLPAAGDPKDAAQVLGLPERCAALSGATWYLPRGEVLREKCPEVFGLSSLAFLRFVPADPRLLVRSVARVLPATQAVTPAYLGVLGDAKGVTVDGLEPWNRSLLQLAATHMPGPVFAALVIASMLAAFLAAIAAALWARPASDDPATSLLLAMLLGGTVIYAVLTTVFGDGMSEASRHFLPGWLAMAALVLGVLVAAPICLMRWGRAPRDNVRPIAAAVLFTAATVAGVYYTFDWANRQPLSIGVLDLPASRQVNSVPLEIRGWTLDPFGVESVSVKLGKVEKPARFGDASADLAAVFPGYPDGARGRFALDFSAEDLAAAGPPEALEMRITTRSKNGHVSEIDRRRLEMRP